MKNFQNFYVETYGLWIRCPQPDRTPDFKSDKPDSASKYWDCGEYVVRKSNHWGVVGSCFWKIDSLPKKGVLNLSAHECAMIHYKDLGNHTQAKIPVRKRFMTMQPDLHHEGPLAVEFVNELINKLKAAIEELITYEPSEEDLNPADAVSKLNIHDWNACKAHWLESMEYAVLRCETIARKLPHAEATPDDHKCVDITLCILRDFGIAKACRFLQKTEAV